MASHTNLPTPNNPAAPAPTTPFTTLYHQILSHLNTEILSARLFSRNTTSHYKEWCSIASSSLAEFATTHSAVETCRATAYLTYHQGNLQNAVVAAQREVREKRVRLAGFLRWCNTPVNGVCEDMLMGYLSQLSGVEVPQPAPAAASVPQHHQRENLIADLTRPDRATITVQEAESTWDRINLWRHSLPASLFIEPPEIYEVLLYDVPISGDVVREMYSGEYREGYDVDVWEERQWEIEVERWCAERVEGGWL